MDSSVSKQAKYFSEDIIIFYRNMLVALLFAKLAGEIKSF